MGTFKSICVIPARGGSKRLPRKNIIDFNGKPIIAHTIEAAKQTGIFDRVIVSTEDEEIESIAKEYGAEVAERDTGLANDAARVVDVCLNFLESEKVKNNKYKILCCLYATAPLRNSDDIRNTYNLVADDLSHFAMAVTEFHQPVHQALKINDSGLLEPKWPLLINKRASEVEQYYVDNGSTYVVRVDKFLQQKTFYGTTLKGYTMHYERSIDIDTELDFHLAKFYSTVVLK